MIPNCYYRIVNELKKNLLSHDPQPGKLSSELSRNQFLCVQ